MYNVNIFHLLKTEGVNQAKGNIGHIQKNIKNSLEFIKILTSISLKYSL